MSLTQPHPLLARLIDRLAAADPAGTRLRLAARALLALALAAAGLFGASRLSPLPPAAYGLGIIITFNCTLAVRDRGWRQQVLTRAAAALVGAGAAILAGALAPWPVVADLGFLAVTFVSVYVRRYGMRWLAIGMVMFMAYFMGEYMHPLPTDALTIAFASALGFLSSQLAATMIPADNPERDFRRALRTIDHRINLILDYLLQAAERGALPNDDLRQMRRQMARFREIVLMAEGFVEPLDGSGPTLTGPAADLGAGLVDLLLAVERLVRYRETALPPPAALRVLLEDQGPRLEAADVRPDPEAAGTSLQLLQDIRRARGRINLALGPGPSPAFARRGGPVPAARQAALGSPRAGVPAAFHRPIQVTLACGLALGFGLMVSPTRWYWAVVTAYIVFNNTRTRADTAVRALHRSTGTLGGVIVGTLVATVLQGHALGSALMIPTLVFLAVYNLQTSYGWMIFFLTIALALFYGLMGMFTPDLLYLRLTETLVGGLSGLAAAFLVFPVRTGGEVARSFEAFLDALGHLVGAAVARSDGGEADLTLAALRLDQRYGDLATAVRPLGGPWSAVTRFGPVRTKLLLLVSCAHWARILARALAADPETSSTERARIAELATEIGAKIAVLRTSAADWFAAGPNTDLGPTLRQTPSVGELRREAAIGALATINDLLDRAVAQTGMGDRAREAGSEPATSLP